MWGKCSKCRSDARPGPLYGLGVCYMHFKDGNAVVERNALVEIATKTKPIKKVSAKKKVEDRYYTKQRKDYLKLNKQCEASLEGCTKEATEVHHKAGRGKNYLNEETWLPVCRNCHTFIEANPAVAKERGLSTNRIANS